MTDTVVAERSVSGCNETGCCTKSGIQRRIDQITRQKFEALREVERLKADNVELEAALARALRVIDAQKSKLSAYTNGRQEAIHG